MPPTRPWPYDGPEGRARLTGSLETEPGPESGEDDDWCRAVSQHGTMVTAYVGGRMAFTRAKPGRVFVCTQDAGHSGSHKACDGKGHVLALWPRKDPEQYWERADCAGHSHG